MRSTHTILPSFFHPLNFTAYACGLEKPTLRPEWAHLGDAKMNVENILKVADAIEKHSIPGLGFNMGNFCDKADETAPDRSGQDCGTVACIAGWAYALTHNSSPGELLKAAENRCDFEEVAADFLGLIGPQVGNLFYAFNHPNSSAYSAWSGIAAEQAVRTLRNLAATGQVDWAA